MARFSGRAPKCSSYPRSTRKSEAAGVSRSVSSSSPSRRCTSLSRIVTIWAMCSRVSGWNTMTSSSRFRNSGLKVLLISSLTFSAILSKVARVSGCEKPRALPLTMSRDMVKGKALGFSQPDTRATFDKMAEKVKEEINKTFNPEFLNRLDDVIVFHPLTREHITQIVSILARDVQKRLGEEELTLRLTQAATDFLVDHGYDEHFGARPLKRAIQKYVEDPLSEKILVGDFAKGDEIEVDVAPDKERLAFRALSGSKA